MDNFLKFRPYLTKNVVCTIICIIMSKIKEYMKLTIALSISIGFLSLVIMGMYSIASDWNNAMENKRQAVEKCQPEKNLPIGQMTGNCYKLFIHGNLN